MFVVSSIWFTSIEITFVSCPSIFTVLESSLSLLLHAVNAVNEARNIIANAMNFDVLEIAVFIILFVSPWCVLMLIINIVAVFQGESHGDPLETLPQITLQI